MKQLLASPSLQLVTYPASATAQSAEFASADCVTGLNEIGQISVSNISGDPQDVERIVALKADECNQVNHLIPTRLLVKGGEITCKMLK
ncbi:DUF1471 domain-containing protein, partial [Escherichia coli]|uniref:DUF1471 domain-containing protein n=1 Tax=Escherichia coli TaxID=562 RepID=UPI00201ED48F